MPSDLPFAEAAERALGEVLFRYLIGRPRDAEASAPDPNAAAMSRYKLVPRVLQGHAGVELSTTLCDQNVAAPLAIGAFAGDRLFHPDGLLPLAEVCHDLRLPLFVSEETVTPLTEITAVHDGCWLQLRAAGTRERAVAMIDAAAHAGVRGVIFTVLAPIHPVPGLQPGGFSLGRELTERGWRTIGSAEPGIEPLAAFPAWSAEDLAAAVRHAARANLPVLAKGILHPADAYRAEEAGCAGMVVSNIGVRQSWRWVAPADCLGGIRQAVRGGLLLDGGVRSGTDVLVAAALGATLAVTTRPAVSALAGGGVSGLRTWLRDWMDEMRAVLAWCGCTTPSDLGPDHLFHAGLGGSITGERQ